LPTLLSLREYRLLRESWSFHYLFYHLWNIWSRLFSFNWVLVLFYWFRPFWSIFFCFLLEVESFDWALIEEFPVVILGWVRLSKANDRVVL
jgi:hypothetical protein